MTTYTTKHDPERPMMVDKAELMSLLQRPIAFHRVFVDLTGSVLAALMLSQAFYWTGKSKTKTDWFWKTQEEWQEETGMTRWEQETARKTLRKTDFWEEQKKGIPAKLYYRVDLAKLMLALTRMWESHIQGCGDTTYKEVVIPHTNTETTTETTTETIIVPEPSVSGPLSEHQQMFQALCDICGWDYKVLGKAEKGQIAQTLGVLKKAGYSLGDLEQFVPRVWVNDWRYQRNRSHPTPTQVRTEIGKLRSEPLPEPPKQRTQYGAGVSLDSVDKVFDEMERLGISYGPQDTNQEALRQLPDSSATRDSRHLPRVPQRVRLAHADVNYQRSD